MKQFIVLLAVLPLMIILLMVFTLDSSMNAKINLAEDIVYRYKEAAKQEGYFSEDIKEGLRDSLEDVFGENIIMAFDDLDSPKQRLSIGSSLDDSLIYYRVSVPIKEMGTIQTLLGFREDSYYFTVEGYATSEYIGETN